MLMLVVIAQLHVVVAIVKDGNACQRCCVLVWHRFVGQRQSAGTAGAGVSVETGWRVKVTESMADRAAPAVVQPRFVRVLRFIGGDPV